MPTETFYDARTGRIGVVETAPNVSSQYAVSVVRGNEANR